MLSVKLKFGDGVKLSIKMHHNDAKAVLVSCGCLLDIKKLEIKKKD